MSGLPVGLRMYRLFSAAAGPFAPILLARRAKRGKEIRQRLPERRGESRIARPDGPLVWLHGASVGELASVLPLIERIRARGIAMLVTTGTVTSGGLAEQRLPRGVVASIRSARCAALRAPLSRPLATRSRLVRRIRSVAEHDDRGIGPRHTDGPGQRPPVGKLVPAVAAAAELDRRSVATARPLPCGHGVRRRSIKASSAPNRW